MAQYLDIMVSLSSNKCCYIISLCTLVVYCSYNHRKQQRLCFLTPQKHPKSITLAGPHNGRHAGNANL